MKKYVVFYCLDSDYSYFYVNAVSLKDAFITADVFSRKFDATIVGICPEYLLNNWNYE